MTSYRAPQPSLTRARIEAGKRRAQQLVQGLRAWANTPTNCSTCSKVRGAAAAIVGAPKER